MMRSRALVVGALAGTVVCTSVQTATVDTLEISKSHGRFQLIAETYLDAPAEEVHAVLLEYQDDLFSRISSVYKESRYLEPDTDGTPRIYTRMEGCILFFCKSMARTERLELIPPYIIRTTALPEESDFEYSYSEWILVPEGSGTHMRYELVMDPKFWVPPVIGPWFIKRAIASGGLRAVQRIERIARGENLPLRNIRYDAGDTDD